MTPETLEAFLLRLGLQQYLKALQAQDITLAVLGELTDAQFKELGLTIGASLSIRKELRTSQDNSAKQVKAEYDAQIKSLKQQIDSLKEQVDSLKMPDKREKPAVSAKPIVETKPIIEAKATVETKPIIETKAVVEGKPIVPTNAVVENKSEDLSKILTFFDSVTQPANVVALAKIAREITNVALAAPLIKQNSLLFLQRVVTIVEVLQSVPVNDVIKAQVTTMVRVLESAKKSLDPFASSGQLKLLFSGTSDQIRFQNLLDDFSSLADTIATKATSLPIATLNKIKEVSRPCLFLESSELLIEQLGVVADGVTDQDLTSKLMTVLSRDAPRGAGWKDEITNGLSAVRSYLKATQPTQDAASLIGHRWLRLLWQRTFSHERGKLDKFLDALEDNLKSEPAPSISLNAEQRQQLASLVSRDTATVMTTALVMSPSASSLSELLEEMFSRSALNQLMQDIPTNLHVPLKNGRDVLAKNVLESAASASLVWIYGASGTGKSVVAAQAAKSAIESGKFTKAFFVSVEGLQSDAIALNIVAKLDPSGYHDDITNALMIYSSSIQVKTLLVIDSLEVADYDTFTLITDALVNNRLLSIIVTSHLDVPSEIPEGFGSVFHLETIEKQTPNDHTLFTSAIESLSVFNGLPFDEQAALDILGSHVIGKDRVHQSSRILLRTLINEGVIFVHSSTLLKVKAGSTGKGPEEQSLRRYQLHYLSRLRRAVALFNSGDTVTAWFIVDSARAHIDRVLFELDISIAILYAFFEALLSSTSLLETRWPGKLELIRKRMEAILATADAKKLAEYAVIAAWVFVHAENAALRSNQSRVAMLVKVDRNLEKVRKLSTSSERINLLNETVGILSSVMGETHWTTALVHEQSGVEHVAANDPSAAQDSFNKALSSMRSVVGHDYHAAIARVLMRLGQLCEASGDFNQALQHHMAALQIRDLVLGVHNIETGVSYMSVGNTYASLGEFSNAQECLERALDTILEVAGEQSEIAAKCFGDLGHVFNSLGDQDEGMENLQRALAIMKAVKGEEAATAELHFKIGLAYHHAKENQFALENYEKALALFKAALGESNSKVSLVYNSIGAVYNDLGENSRAVRIYERATSITKNCFGEEHAETAMSYLNLGIVCRQSGDVQRSLEYHEKALTLFKITVGEHHRHTARALFNLGILYERSMKDYSRALQYYEQALVIRTELFGESHDDTALIYESIASVSASLGDYQRALDCTKRALSVRINNFGKIHEDVASLHVDLGHIYNKLALHTNALESLKEGLAIQQDLFEDDAHPSLAALYISIGNTNIDLNNYSDAIVSFQKALAIRQEALGEDHVKLASLHVAMGNAYKQLSKYDGAFACFDQALKIYQAQDQVNNTEVITVYTELASLCDSMGHFDRALIARKEILELLTAELSETHEDVALAYVNVGNTYVDLNDYKSAVSYFVKAVAIQETTLGEDHPSLATLYFAIGTGTNIMGDYTSALENFENALRIRRAELGDNDLEITRINESIGAVYDGMGEYEQALEYKQAALKVMVAILGDDRPDVATLYMDIGNIYTNLDDNTKALENFAKALNIKQKSLGSNNLEVAALYISIGNIHDSMSNFADALSNYQRALAIRKNNGGDKDLEAAALYIDIGNVYRNLDNHNLALENFDRALTIKKSVLGPSHPEVTALFVGIANVYKSIGDPTRAREYYQKDPDTYDNVAKVFINLGDWSRALEMYEQGLTLRRNIMGDMHPDTAVSYNNVAMVYNNTGDRARAIEYAEKALNIRKAKLGEQHPATATSYTNLGNIMKLSGDLDGALTNLEQGLTIRKAVLGETRPETAASYKNVGDVLKIKKDLVGALEHYVKALLIRRAAFGERHLETITLSDMIRDVALDAQSQQIDVTPLLSHIGGIPAPSPARLAAADSKANVLAAQQNGKRSSASEVAPEIVITSPTLAAPTLPIPASVGSSRPTSHAVGKVQLLPSSTASMMIKSRPPSFYVPVNDSVQTAFKLTVTNDTISPLAMAVMKKSVAQPTRRSGGSASPTVLLLQKSLQAATTGSGTPVAQLPKRVLPSAVKQPIVGKSFKPATSSSLATTPSVTPLKKSTSIKLTSKQPTVTTTPPPVTKTAPTPKPVEQTPPPPAVLKSTPSAAKLVSVTNGTQPKPADTPPTPNPTTTTTQPPSTTTSSSFVRSGSVSKKTGITLAPQPITTTTVAPAPAASTDEQQPSAPPSVAALKRQLTMSSEPANGAGSPATRKANKLADKIALFDATK